MLNPLEEVGIDCPYCGESILILVDCSLEYQTYIEDCQVCCRPIYLSIGLQNGSGPRVITRREND